ncbi:MAG: right-handed parallel beta-helix repeat-containing protein [Magnetococcales bacterium]|nr:right-handed parallel beta-helix repeat-containing protein [Magnetococcales bacterium]
MIRARTYGFVVSLVVAFALLGGCLPTSFGKQHSPTMDVGADFEFPVRVAILPFVNHTDDPAAADIVRRLFFNFFSSLNYRDKELFSIDKTLRKDGLYQHIVDGGNYPLNRVCRSLDVDALILGEVNTFGKLFALVYAQREVSLKAEFYQCSREKLLWSREEKSIERDASLFSDMTAMFMTVVKTYVSHKRASSIQNAAKLSMSMVATIPNPLEVSEPPPKIKHMIHNGDDRIIQPGETLRTVLVGDPGLAAYWDISEDIQDLPLREKTPGVYIGEYVVQPGDRVVDGHLNGRLISNEGVTAHWMGVTDGIFLGLPTIPPIIVKSDLVFTAPKSPYLVKDLLLIKPGATLFINPGVIILFENSGIIVQGTIEALGSEKQPILLSGESGNRWKGLLLDKGSGTTRLKHVLIRDARYGIKARESSMVINNCAFQENIWGLVVESGSKLTISKSHIHGSELTGLSAKDAEIEITESFFSGNTGGGIQVDKTKITMRDSDIFNNTPWEFRNHNKGKTLQIGQNWWGTKDHKKVALQGAVDIQPMRQAPATKIMLHKTRTGY